METVMSYKVADTLLRDTLGKFAPKSEVPRKVRSVNLTDEAWQWLAAVAEKAGMSRNDYLEALAEGIIPLIETVKPQHQPFIKTANVKTEVDEVNIEKQPETEFYPFIETVLTEVESVKLELEVARAENELLQLANSEVEVETLNQELASLREQLETERASREEIEAELSELKQNSAPVATLSEKLAPDAATILSQLRAKRKKSPVSLADLEAILEIVEKS
jgi:DNA repair exonuclease SbcCD ATPase subunit